MIIFCRIMDDGRPHMWTCFIMENETTTIVAPPLFKEFSHPWLLHFHYYNYQLSNGVIRKKTSDDETNVRRRWNDIALANIFDLFEEHMHLDKSCLSFKHWIHIHIEHHRQLMNECHRKEEQIKDKIKKMESEYPHQKTLLEEQTKGSGSTWFTQMTTIYMEGFAKGDGALGSRLIKAL